MSVTMKHLARASLAALMLAGCAHRGATPAGEASEGKVADAQTELQLPSLHAAAERYVILLLALGEHDPDSVDAYYGPAALKERAKARALSLESIRGEAARLRDELRALEAPRDMDTRRRAFLDRQLSSLLARIDVVEGNERSFDEESQAIYDAVSPDLNESHFDALLAALEQTLPGEGTVAARFERLRKAVEIPTDKLDAVIRRAVAGCRERTLQHLSLPANERFTVEYVTDKPWSGYNWYKGNFHSLIQINTSLPIHIDRAIDLACHEGYPGHHVYNVLLERLVDEHGYVELTVYPLFSGQSLIAEGSANYGVDLAFPGEIRVAWEKEHLFPLAGLDPEKAEPYYRALELTHALSYAGNVAAKRYLDGEITRAQAKAWLERYTLATPERAEQRMRFTEKYRAYVINYNVGKDLVRDHVHEKAGDDSERRWAAFLELLSAPSLPEDLRK